MTLFTSKILPDHEAGNGLDLTYLELRAMNVIIRWQTALLLAVVTTLALAAAPNLQGAPAAASASEAAADTEPAVNFHRYDPLLASSGHFVDDGLTELAADGVEVIIHLRPEVTDEQLTNVLERDIVWLHIPIDWEAPELAHFEEFTRMTETHAGKHTLVQCAMNFRASTMTFLHRVINLGVPVEQAHQDLLDVWEPNDVWQKFIDDTLST